MRNFDIRQYLQRVILEQDEEGNQADQSQGSNVGPPPQTPNNMQSAMKKISSPFDDFLEKTVKSFEFQPGKNGGSIKILFDGEAAPVVISWQNNKTTLRTSDGKIIELM